MCNTQRVEGDETCLESVESENEVSTRYRTIHIQLEPQSQTTYNQSCIKSQRARTTAKELKPESQSESIASARAKKPEPESQNESEQEDHSQRARNPMRVRLREKAGASQQLKLEKKQPEPE